jgi:hypothetical protein
MEPEGSLPCLQESSTGPYPQPDQSNPSHPISLRSSLSLRSFIQRIRPSPRLLVIFRNKLIFYGEELLDPRPTSKWRTTPCRLSATAYSIYSHLPFIPGGCLLHPQPEDAPCRGPGILQTRKQRFGNWICFRPQVRGEDT